MPSCPEPFLNLAVQVHDTLKTEATFTEIIISCDVSMSTLLVYKELCISIISLYLAGIRP
jgi:hypothetical protein